MRVVFRADASTRLGSGHVMRCLTLAGSLRSAGVQVEFICRRAPGDLVEFISQEHGLPVHEVPEDCDPLAEAELSAQILTRGERPEWLVVDHYEYAAEWHRKMRSHVSRIMVIDDLADRRHDCDLLLDQNLHDNQQVYDALVPPTCVKLIGPNYALLRPEFSAARAHVTRQAGPIKRILISFGGTDPTNETAAVLKQLLASQFADRFEIDCVVGKGHTALAEVRALAAIVPKVTLHVQSGQMARLMTVADLCIGAGGATTWERCCLGLPSLTVAVADNQVHFGKRLGRLGYCYYLGHPRENKIDYVGALRTAIDEPAVRLGMARRGMELVDGKGAGRVATTMLEMS